MKTILIPTDFSKGTDYLIKTGINLSHNMEAGLTLLYSVEPVNTSTATPSYALYGIAKKEYEKDKRIALNKYQKLYDKFKDQLQGDLPFEFIVEKGDRVNNIISTADRIDSEMILLPQEHEGALQKILGETNNRIIQQVKIPVCIIPTHKEYSLFLKAGFLCDYEENFLKVLKDVKKLVKILKTNLVVLYPKEIEEFESLLLFEGFKKLTAKILRGIKTDHVAFDPNDYLTNIKRVIKENGIDILAIVNENENMLQRWFNQATSEKLMDELEMPVIIFSQNK